MSSSGLKITISDKLVEKGLAEIYQSMEVKMALLTSQGQKEFTRITPWVKCRDFLVDVYTYAEANKKFQIYSMEYDPEKLGKPQTSAVYLQVEFPKKKKAKEVFKEQIGLLHKIETQNGFDPTEVYETGDDKETVVLVGDKKWLYSAISFSLYTSLLRILCHKELGNDFISGFIKKHESSSDHPLVKSVDPSVWEKVLGNIKLLKMEEFCGFSPKSQNIGTIHHNSGFYSVFGSHSEMSETLVMKNSHWKHFTKLGWKMFTVEKK